MDVRAAGGEVVLGVGGAEGRVTQRERQQTFFSDIVFPSPGSSPKRKQSGRGGGQGG